jgi:carbamoyltransferase
MIVLGLHGGYKREEEDEPLAFAWHDSAAVLIRDGEILAAIEEERLDRIKHSNAFPFRALRHCLEVGGVGIREVDAIAINSAPDVVNTRDRVAVLQDATVAIPLRNAATLSRLLHEALGEDVGAKLRFCHHHIAHAWSAYAPSGFTDSLILSLDGEGDFCSGMVLVGRDGVLQPLHVFTTPQSLGSFYHQMIGFVGCTRFDEYKIMALASYGDKNVFASQFAKWYRLLPEGNYELAGQPEWFRDLNAAGLIFQARRRDEPFTQLHKDFAAALQAAIEHIVLHVLRHYQAVTGQTNLCLAGGVAHNCSVNGKILYANLFRNIFVQPAAHDAGGALGAAWAVLCDGRKSRPSVVMNHLYLGSEIGDADYLRSRLDAWGDFLSFSESSDVAADAANLLAGGSVIGWAQGRAEFGPRALGNRSILADPRPAANKTLINAMVKKREQYRPFAPSVTEEHAHEYFELPPGQTSFPYMIMVLRVQERMRRLLGAVTHVDGTARVQTVSRHSNPLFWSLIDNFGALTGVPVLLNTSFNNHAEPIVNSVDEAIVCLLTTGLNYLVVGPYIVTKKAPALAADAVLNLVVDLPLSRKIVKRRRIVDGVVQPLFEIASTRSSFFGPVAVPVSAEIFSILQTADGETTVVGLLDRLHIRGAARRARVTAELVDLWGGRVITLQPPKTAFVR